MRFQWEHSPKPPTPIPFERLRYSYVANPQNKVFFCQGLWAAPPCQGLDGKRSGLRGNPPDPRGHPEAAPEQFPKAGQLGTTECSGLFPPNVFGTRASSGPVGSWLQCRCSLRLHSRPDKPRHPTTQANLGNCMQAP